MKKPVRRLASLITSAKNATNLILDPLMRELVSGTAIFVAPYLLKMNLVLGLCLSWPGGPDSCGCGHVEWKVEGKCAGGGGPLEKTGWREGGTRRIM